jgi:hypothetical protein
LALAVAFAAATAAYNCTCPAMKNASSDPSIAAKGTFPCDA